MYSVINVVLSQHFHGGIYLPHHYESTILRLLPQYIVVYLQYIAYLIKNLTKNDINRNDKKQKEHKELNIG